jgi:hypothetical protein
MDRSDMNKSELWSLTLGTKKQVLDNQMTDKVINEMTNSLLTLVPNPASVSQVAAA